MRPETANRDGLVSRGVFKNANSRSLPTKAWRWREKARHAFQDVKPPAWLLGVPPVIGKTGVPCPLAVASVAGCNTRHSAPAIACRGGYWGRGVALISLYT